jgi:hypothetical protein
LVDHGDQAGEFCTIDAMSSAGRDDRHQLHIDFGPPLADRKIAPDAGSHWSSWQSAVQRSS